MAGRSETSDPPRAGRPKDPGIDIAVRAAVLEILAEDGYAALTIGQVARRAEVYRPAIYRRWPSKQHLVVDAVAGTLGRAPTPDTGDLRADLVAGMSTLVEGFDGTVLGRVLPALVGDLSRHPDLREAFLDEVFASRRSCTAAALDHAVARGDIRGGYDEELVLDALCAPIYYRVLFGHAPLDAGLVERTVDLVLAALR